MNGERKATIADVYEKLGSVGADTKAIIKRLDDGDKKINILEEQVTKNSMSIKYIYGGIGIIVAGIAGTVFKLWNKIWGG